MNQFEKISRKQLETIRPYEPGKPIEEVKAEFGLDSIVKLASNENPLGPSPKAVSAIQGALDELHLYPDGNGTALKNAICRQFPVSPNQISVGNGSDELIKRLAETFLSPGDEIIVAQPTFSEYKFAAQLMGAATKEVPCRDGFLDLEGFRGKLSSQTKMIFICNPNNPTGTHVGQNQIAQFLSDLPSELLVVFDEAYAEYVTAEDYVSGVEYLANNENVIVLRTFSKIYGLAALRIGYALASPKIIQLMEKAREPFNVNRVAQIGAVAALSDTDHVSRSRAINDDGMKRLVAAFSDFGWTPLESQANFILVDTGQDARALFQSLLAKGVIIRPADIFGMPTHIRVTVGTPDEIEFFLTATRKVLNL